MLTMRGSWGNKLLLRKSPLLFDQMAEPLIKWLTASGKDYNIASRGLRLASKWYADDITLLTNSVEDVISWT
jgi:hypothetical protein